MGREGRAGRTESRELPAEIPSGKCIGLTPAWSYRFSPPTLTCTSPRTFLPTRNSPKNSRSRTDDPRYPQPNDSIPHNRQDEVHSFSGAPRHPRGWYVTLLYFFSNNSSVSSLARRHALLATGRLRARAHRIVKGEPIDKQSVR
jgi:hypothetical protein